MSKELKEELSIIENLQKILNEEPFDILTFIMRGQIITEAHKKTIEAALSLSPKVIVLLGSAHAARSIRNPFTWEERASVLTNIFTTEVAENRLLITPLEDATYNNDLWIKNVQQAVQGIVAIYCANKPKNIGLIGHSKDSSSFYLKMFPNWKSVNIENIDNINATDVREEYFDINTRKLDLSTQAKLPKEMLDFLAKFRDKPEFLRITEENDYCKKYKKSWENAPYPPVFVTADCCIIQSGHVLLIKRKAAPGKGLLALPGGFLNQTETIEDAAIRELREETKIKIPEAVLRGSIKKQKVFDDPNRSSRGRVITHAFLIKLRDEIALPKVKGSDDAEAAGWFSLASLKPNLLFEDHYFLIQNLIADL